MKNSYVQLPIYFLAAWLLLPTVLRAQTTTTVYTPKGTAVTATIYSEFSSDQIASANSQAEAQYPYAQRITDASRRYNCHAYAWYIPNNPYAYYSWVWINDPGDDTFWQDGSYVEICNESEAQKISYYNGDHSAIRSTVAGKYDSKWGQLPAMRHDPTYGPLIYNMTYRKYYISTKIAASYPTCGSATYSVPYSANCSYNWTASSNVTLNTTSGSSVNGTLTGTSPGWVDVTINVPCTGKSVTSHFDVPVPAQSAEPTGNYSHPVGSGLQLATVNTVVPGEIRVYLDGSYTYTFTPNPATVPIFGGPGRTAAFSLKAGEGVGIAIRGVGDACNVSRTVVFTTNRGYYSYSFAPNPASSDLTVTATDPNQAAGPSAPAAEPFDAALYDTFGQKIKTKKSDKGKAVLDVRDLPAGLYNLRAGKGKEAISEHIQVTH